MQASLLQKLGILDCAVLEKKSDATFSLIHSNKAWLSAILPDGFDSGVILENGISDYLNDFLYDAIPFWDRNIDGRINSGIWTEQTSSGLWRLEASAITNDNAHYLVIINIANEHNSRQRLLQVARELLVSNDQILEQHQLMHARISSLTYSPDSESAPHTVIEELIRHTEFGIAVVDVNMQPLEQNPALFQMFELKRDTKAQPVSIILDLCQRQFPEFQRIFSRQEKWTGELYWVKPDAISRWLQLTICPVKSDTNELSNWLFLLTDISREKYLQQSNEKLIYFDVMTDLPNRKYFWHSLESAIDKNSSFFVLRMNIKHVQRINEAYGYSIGDEVIIEVVSRLKLFIDNGSIFARLGGNEFAMIFYLSEQKECEHVAKQLIEIACKPIRISSQLQFQIKLDIGVAHYPNDEVCAEELIRYADLAAFFGKEKEKNSIHFYSENLKNQSILRIELEASLRNAIEQKQFELYLQPIYDLNTGVVIKAEALIRWNKPGVGLVGPDEFIHIAEETGLIVAIGQWVIDESIRLLEILHNQNRHITLAINLSPVQIQDQHLLSTIKNSVSHSKINVASYLQLELTEGVLIEDFDKIQVFLSEVRKLGITTAIDDFGTGYSSLSYLQKLPIDHLKIDRSFIQALNIDNSENAIVLAIIAMAESLKLGVIAEGVENEMQQEFLRINNCQSAQGYLFSRPLPFAHFIESSSLWPLTIS